MSSRCPICEQNLNLDPNQQYGKTGDKEFYNCFRCGKFFLAYSALSDLGNIITSEETIARASYQIRNQLTNTNPPTLLTYDLTEFVSRPLPNLNIQLANFINWFGSVTTPGIYKKVEWTNLISIIGSLNQEEFDFVVEYLRNSNLIELDSFQGMGPVNYRLSFGGWEKYNQFIMGKIDSYKAFMAMAYGNMELTKFVNAYFRPAVKATGFDLERLDDYPKAGLIDDRLRVEINTAQFLIADLSNSNNGAYWESGYAEGLGKPVIYTCEKSVFDDEDKKPHFDTNHHLTVVYEYDKPDEFMADLKAVIRATLPDKAKLQD